MSKNVSINFRLNEELKNEITIIANELGVSVSSYLVMVINEKLGNIKHVGGEIARQP